MNHLTRNEARGPWMSGSGSGLLELMAAAPAFMLLTVVLFIVAVCLYSLKQHKAKEMHAQAERLHALAQQQAREQEAHLDAAGNHLALAVQGTQDGLWYWDLKTNIFRFSSGWETLLGFAKGELSQNPNEWFSRVHPAYRAELDARIGAHLRGETEQFRYEHRMRRYDGSYFWVSARATATRDGSG